MTETAKLIAEGVVAVLLIGRGIMSHFEHKKSHLEHKKTGRDIHEIKISINGELEKRIAEERKKWEQEIKK